MLEEDGDDSYITQETLKEIGIDISIQFLSNSSDFFNFLSNSIRPALILIDYNSNPDNGLDVLRQLKSNASYSTIPVVILSDSDHPHRLLALKRIDSWLRFVR
jgi:CheY-like chemotaxis protein